MSQALKARPLRFTLQAPTSEAWWPCVEKNFDSFLINHAACERKASATGIQFVVKYPDRRALIEPMINLAREELMHFHQVTRLIYKRGLQMASDERDPYMTQLLAVSRNGRDEHFLDRLLIFGIVEARGTERFGLVAKNIQDPELKLFYSRLTEAEERHHELFIEIAEEYFSAPVIESRLADLLAKEAQIFSTLDLLPRVH